MKITKKQVKSIKEQVKGNSVNQHYYSKAKDLVFSDREAQVYCKINEEIESGNLIPFVPAFDL